MAARPGGAFGEEDHGLPAFERLRDCDGLLLGALAVAAPDINGVILVREPVDERVTQLLFRNEGAIDRAAEHEDVEPAHVIGHEQGVAMDSAAVAAHARAGDPGRGGEEASRPVRMTQDELCRDMHRTKDREQQQQAGDAERRAGIQANSLSVRD